MNASSILVRRDRSNLPAIFLLDSLDVSKGQISVWHGDPSEQPHVADLSYYRATAPTSDADEASLIDAYRKAFNPPGGIVLRRRLFKVNPDHPSYVPPAKQAEKPAPVTLVNSQGNKSAQQRESSPQEASKHPVQAAQHSPLGDIEKVLLVERITHAFATSFAKAMSEAITTALK